MIPFYDILQCIQYRETKLSRDGMGLPGHFPVVLQGSIFHLQFLPSSSKVLSLGTHSFPVLPFGQTFEAMRPTMRGAESKDHIVSLC